jgi:glycosyltransferase involved in cell wall biosynthesis
LRPVEGADGSRDLRLDDLSAVGDPDAMPADGGSKEKPSNAEGQLSAYSNLTFRIPEDYPLLLRLLRTERPVVVEAHHFLGHDPAIWQLAADLGVPCEAHVHDYAWFCQRVSLVDGTGHYCGEPDAARCDACVADHGRFIAEDINSASLRERSLRFLGAAAGVVAPSTDVARRISRHFPGIEPQVVPLEDDASLPPLLRHPESRLVCVAGAIGLHKGYDVLLACARDAASRALDLSFVVVGTTIDDARLMATGRVFITGRYAAAEAIPLIARQRAALGFLPSISPETWSFTLTELWRAGLRVAAFDIGAPAERIRRTGRGFLLPPHATPGAINAALLAGMADDIPASTTVPAKTHRTERILPTGRFRIAIQPT